jgi:4-alpha-glucanotransferase
MRFPRASGILLHPTSLPGPFGIGELGPAAGRFVDFLAGAGQRLWQVLPLSPTGFGDSPYQCFSAFAGNPLLISLEQLVLEGLLSASDLDPLPDFPKQSVDYGRVIHFKLPLLKRSFEAFTNGASARAEDFEDFCQTNKGWLTDYALFMAIKQTYHGKVWTEWDRSIALREPEAVRHWSVVLKAEIEAQKYFQYQFFRQWEALRRHALQCGVSILGDLPIYVAHDSADVWAHPEMFYLDDTGNPALVAGVPPDYFSATGQLWGNPLYRWDKMAASGYRWWVERFRTVLSLVDRVRLDHFRGFEAYWEIPAAEPTAIRGQWVQGPGATLFEELQGALGELPIVAENLGVITPEVEAIRERFGYPGMSILQFAFGRDPQGPSFQPHNYSRNLVAYTGTHDNDTTVGWFTSRGTDDSTRTLREIDEERRFACDYLGTNGREIHWVFIRTLLASVADSVIVPLQDLLGLGSEARLNRPSTATGNWCWRYTQEELTLDLQQRLKRMTVMYGR